MTRRNSAPNVRGPEAHRRSTEMFRERRSAMESAPSQAGHDERLEVAQLAHDPPHDPALAQSPHVPFLRTRATTRTNAIAIILRIMKSTGPIMQYFLYSLSSWNQNDDFWQLHSRQRDHIPRRTRQNTRCVPHIMPRYSRTSIRCYQKSTEWYRDLDAWRA